MNYFNFAEMVKVGDKGVKLVAAALRQHQPPYNCFAINRKDNRRLNYDIELVARRNINALAWRSYHLEVKCDRHDGVNFFIELISQEEKGTVGGFLGTTADYLFYFFLKPRKLYIFDVPTLKRWIVNNQYGYCYNPVRTPTGNTHYTTSGIVVPVRHLLHLNLTFQGFYNNIVI